MLHKSWYPDHRCSYRKWVRCALLVPAFGIALACSGPSQPASGHDDSEQSDGVNCLTDMQGIRVSEHGLGDGYFYVYDSGDNRISAYFSSWRPSRFDEYESRQTNTDEMRVEVLGDYNGRRAVIVYIPASSGGPSVSIGPLCGKQLTLIYDSIEHFEASRDWVIQAFLSE